MNAVNPLTTVAIHASRGFKFKEYPHKFWSHWRLVRATYAFTHQKMKNSRNFKNVNIEKLEKVTFKKATEDWMRICNKTDFK